MKLLGIALFLAVLLSLTGCQKGNVVSSDSLDISTGQMPDYLVGIWEADKYDWGFKFEEDGSISKMVHNLAGPMVVKEGGKELEGPDEGTFAFFVLGTTEAVYDSNDRQLKVKVFLDSFYMKLPNGVLEGRCEDYFSGRISADGKKWQAKWFNYTWLEGADPPDREAIEANPELLIFTKTEKYTNVGADEYKP